MTSSSPVIVQLPRPYRDEDELQRYALRSKEIRLKALANDPGSFSSSLDLEKDQPIEFWKTRLLHPEARHFIACLPAVPEAESETDVDASNSKWVATLVLFGPRTIDVDNFMQSTAWKRFTDGSPKPTQLPLEGSTLMYYIQAVYVDSQCRRQGLGRRLSIKALEAIRADILRVQATQAVCMIGAEEKNESALKLYESLGWKRVGEDRFIAKDGRKIVGIQMRLDVEAGE